MRPFRPPILVALALAGAGCGGSSSSSGGPPAPATTSGPPVTTPASTAPGPETVTGVLPAKRPETPVRASLTATGHRPVAGESWSFTVNAKNKDGSPTPGTVRAILIEHGKLYDTIGWYGFKGQLRHSVVFPLERKDLPLVFEAQVIANGGVVNLDYPIKVR